MLIMIIMVYILRERDVAGIDVNMGCPKDFSLKVSSEIHPHNFIITVYNINYVAILIPSSQD